MLNLTTTLHMYFHPRCHCPLYSSFGEDWGKSCPATLVLRTCPVLDYSGSVECVCACVDILYLRGPAHPLGQQGHAEAMKRGFVFRSSINSGPIDCRPSRLNYAITLVMRCASGSLPRPMFPLLSRPLGTQSVCVCKCRSASTNVSQWWNMFQPWRKSVV